jgi:hypothetical protein
MDIYYHIVSVFKPYEYLTFGTCMMRCNIDSHTQKAVKYQKAFEDLIYSGKLTRGLLNKYRINQ